MQVTLARTAEGQVTTCNTNLKQLMAANVLKQHLNTKCSKEGLFIRTQTHSLQILGVIAFVKPTKWHLNNGLVVKNDENWDEKRNNFCFVCLSYVVCLSSASNIFPSTGQAKGIAQPKTTQLNQKREVISLLISSHFSSVFTV